MGLMPYLSSLPVDTHEDHLRHKQWPHLRVSQNVLACEGCPMGVNYPS